MQFKKKNLLCVLLKMADNNSWFTAVFQDNLDKPVPENDIIHFNPGY